MPNTTETPDTKPRRWQVFADAVARRTDDQYPAVWLAKEIGAKDKGTGYDMLSAEYQPKDFPRIRNIRLLSQVLHLRQMDIIRLFARDLGIEDDDPGVFVSAIDSRADKLSPQRRRAAHLMISLLCDQQEEVDRLRDRLAEHGIDAD
jgi:hypothetical protein